MTATSGMATGGTTKVTGDTTMAMGSSVTGGTTMAMDGTMTRHDEGNGRHEDAARRRRRAEQQSGQGGRLNVVVF